MRDIQKCCWQPSSKYLFFWTWTRLLTSLMILFLYKCIKIVVLNVLQIMYCLTWSNTLSQYLLLIHFVIQICVYFPLHYSAVLRFLSQYISDGTFHCCCCCLWIQLLMLTVCLTWRMKHSMKHSTVLTVSLDSKSVLNLQWILVNQMLVSAKLYLYKSRITKTLKYLFIWMSGAKRNVDSHKKNNENQCVSVTLWRRTSSFPGTVFMHQVCITELSIC